MAAYYINYINHLLERLQGMIVTNHAGKQLQVHVAFQQLCDLSRKVAEAERTQYLCGNGASSAFANHMALDWTKNGGIPTHSFSDSALLTALGNDIGYDEVFSAQIGWHGKPGDMLIAITSSGNSANIRKAIDVARSKGLTVVTFTGLSPSNACRKLGDINLYIPAKTYGMVECAHQVLLHIWLDQFMNITEWNRDGFQNMNRENFSL